MLSNFLKNSSYITNNFGQNVFSLFNQLDEKRFSNIHKNVHVHVQLSQCKWVFYNKVMVIFGLLLSKLPLAGIPVLCSLLC